MSQLSKNTVSAKNQVKSKELIRCTDADNGGVRVMFLGNSITFHGTKPEIGWYNSWGMAASAEEKDYVHILMRYVRKTNPDAAFCVCHGGKWERHYQEDIDFYDQYSAARDFGADVIIVRIIENCRAEDFDNKKFKKELMQFIKYLSGSKSPKLIFTTSFWKHPGDIVVKELSKESESPLVSLGDLGQNEEMMAIGIFKHEGVSIHPGDKGMQAIADRIYSVLKDMI